MHEKSLEDSLPQSDTRRPTFYLCEQSHTDFFGTRNCLVWVACLRVRGTTGGRACASRGGGRAREASLYIYRTYYNRILCAIGYRMPMYYCIRYPGLC